MPSSWADIAVGDNFLADLRVKETLQWLDIWVNAEVDNSGHVSVSTDICPDDIVQIGSQIHERGKLVTVSVASTLKREVFLYKLLQRLARIW